MAAVINATPMGIYRRDEIYSVSTVQFFRARGGIAYVRFPAMEPK